MDHRAARGNVERLPQVVALNVGLFIGVFTVPAHADSWWIDEGSGYLVPGYIHSETWGRDPASGNGIELTYDYFPRAEGPGWPGYGFGLIGQWERYLSPAHDRFAVGGQLIGPLYGLELAYAHRAEDRRLATHGIHVAPFVSIGILSLAVRGTFPVAPAQGGYGSELGFTLGVKIPILLHGEGFDMSFPHGRPLTVDERAVVATLSPAPKTNGWATQTERPGLDRALDSLRADERAAVADHWLRSALEEHASIASFSRLSLELLSLGAPPDLVEGAHRAAVDELRHARSCLGIARAVRPDTPELGVFPDATLSVRPVTIAELARVTFREGCLGEQRAARALARAAKVATSTELAETLRGLSRDEARHAEFAWRLIEWCLQEDRIGVGYVVNDALTEELASLPTPPCRELPSGWGRLSAAQERHVWRAVAVHAKRRWQRLTEPALTAPFEPMTAPGGFA